MIDLQEFLNYSLKNRIGIRGKPGRIPLGVLSEVVPLIHSRFLDHPYAWLELYNCIESVNDNEMLGWAVSLLEYCEDRQALFSIMDEVLRPATELQGGSYEHSSGVHVLQLFSSKYEFSPGANAFRYHRFLTHLSNNSLDIDLLYNVVKIYHKSMGTKHLLMRGPCKEIYTVNLNKPLFRVETTRSIF